MDEQYVFFHRVFDCFVHRPFVPDVALSKTHVDDAGSVVNGIDDSVGHVFVSFVAIGNGPDGHDPNIIGYSFDSNVVVAGSSDDPGNVGAVTGIRSHDVIIAIIALISICVIIADDLGPGVKSTL